MNTAMSKNKRSWGRVGSLALVVVAALGLTACDAVEETGDERSGAEASADTQVAVGDTGPTEMAREGTPQARGERPRTETPPVTEETPTAEPPEAGPREGGGTLTVAEGTSVTVTLLDSLSTEHNEAGDAFTVVTAQPLQAGGRLAVPAGTEIRGTVTAVQHSEGAGRPAVLKVDFEELRMGGQAYPIQASVVDANAETRGRTSTAEGAAQVGATTAAGAILGRIIGGGERGTLVGAAVGAAAGTAIVLGTQDTDAVLAEGSAMTIRLDQPLEIPAEAVAATR